MWDPAHRRAVRSAVLDGAAFVRLTARSRPAPGEDRQAAARRRMLVRPVLIAGQSHLQFSRCDGRRDRTSNWRGADAERKLDALLDEPLAGLHVRTRSQDLSVQFTAAGRTILHRRAAPDAGPVDLAHNREKSPPLGGGDPGGLLQALGVAGPDGRVYPRMQDKLTQINEFLKLLRHTGCLEAPPGRPLRIVDCGCGAAYLTLAAHHFVRSVLGLPVETAGVDREPEAVAKAAVLAQRAGLTGTAFFAADIAAFAPEAPPDVVIALHACDTATDDAIAAAVRWRARAVLCAPCCHHHLHAHMQVPPELAPVARHGILRQRMGDVLTDALRAQLLVCAGYGVQVVEFVSGEHTDRNVMIRAVRRTGADDAAAARAASVREYVALRNRFAVQPYLEAAVVPLVPGLAEAIAAAAV